MSLPARGAWIEIAVIRADISSFSSLPARGAWIEICSVIFLPPNTCCRSPHGERGLKLRGAPGDELLPDRRSPHGERGLKYILQLADIVSTQSLPARGAWIEIGPHGSKRKKYAGSLPARGAWIEIRTDWEALIHEWSRSPHGERGLKCLYQGAGGLGLGGRSPHGERGLKYVYF